jgi:arylsulfatase
MLADGAVKIPTLDEAEHPGSDVEGPGQEKRQRQNDLEVYGFSDWNLEGEIAGSGLDGYNKDESIKASAVQWLREKGSGLNKTGRPFFLAVNFVNPHDIVYYNPNPGGQRTVM